MIAFTTLTYVMIMLRVGEDGLTEQRIETFADVRECRETTERWMSWREPMKIQYIGCAPRQDFDWTQHD